MVIHGGSHGIQRLLQRGVLHRHHHQIRRRRLRAGLQRELRRYAVQNIAVAGMARAALRIHDKTDLTAFDPADVLRDPSAEEHSQCAESDYIYRSDHPVFLLFENT